MVFPVYSSDLNDDEWALLGPLIPNNKPHGRPRSSDMRRITNALPTHYQRRLLCAAEWLWQPQAQ